MSGATFMIASLTFVSFSKFFRRATATSYDAAVSSPHLFGQVNHVNWRCFCCWRNRPRQLTAWTELASAVWVCNTGRWACGAGVGGPAGAMRRHAPSTDRTCSFDASSTTHSQSYVLHTAHPLVHCPASSVSSQLKRTSHRFVTHMAITVLRVVHSQGEREVRKHSPHYVRLFQRASNHVPKHLLRRTSEPGNPALLRACTQCRPTPGRPVLGAAHGVNYF